MRKVRNDKNNIQKDCRSVIDVLLWKFLFRSKCPNLLAFGLFIMFFACDSVEDFVPPSPIINCVRLIQNNQTDLFINYENGRVVEILLANRVTGEIVKRTLSYGDDGRSLLYKEVSGKDFANLNFERAFFYDERGKLLGYLAKGFDVDSVLFSYDQGGKPFMQTNFSNSAVSIDSFGYNDRGNIAEHYFRLGCQAEFQLVETFKYEDELVYEFLFHNSLRFPYDQPGLMLSSQNRFSVNVDCNDNPAPFEQESTWEYELLNRKVISFTRSSASFGTFSVQLERGCD